MNHTPNLNLPQWEASDFIRRTDFNTAMSAIDTGVAGGTRIATGTYIGTGQSEQAHPNTLSFAFTPKVVIIIGNKAYSNALTLISPAQTVYFPMDSRFVNVTWSANSVSWYQRTSGADYQMNTANVTYTYIAIG